MKQRIGLKIVLGLCIMYTGWCIAAQPLVPNWKPTNAAYLCIGTSAVGFKKIGSTWRMVRFSLTNEGKFSDIKKEFLIKPGTWTNFTCNAKGSCSSIKYKTLVVRAFGASQFTPNMFHLTGWTKYQTLFFTDDLDSHLRFNTVTGRFMSWSTFGYWTANISSDPWMEIGTCQKIS